MECSQGVNDVLPNRFFILTSVFDKRESISRGLKSLYWLSERFDHEKRLRNGELDREDKMAPERVVAYPAAAVWPRCSRSGSARPIAWRLCNGPDKTRTPIGWRAGTWPLIGWPSRWRPAAGSCGRAGCRTRAGPAMAGSYHAL